MEKKMRKGQDGAGSSSTLIKKLLEEGDGRSPLTLNRIKEATWTWGGHPDLGKHKTAL